jgi:hypothetical protein
MAQLSRNTAMSIAIQPVQGVFTAPNTTTDQINFSNLRPSIQSVNVESDEYTGSIFTNGAAVAGKNCTATFNVKLRGPSALPAASAWVVGRLMQAAKFVELRNSAAIPASPAALGTGSDATHAKLGASAGTTDELYKGYPLLLSDIGATYAKQLTAIRHYVGATKAAELFQTLGSAPAANWQIPTFLMYSRDITSASAPYLSAKIWLAGKRYDVLDMGVTGLTITKPTSTNTQAQYPELQFTVGFTISATSDDPAPSIPAAGATSLIKDGDAWLAQTMVALTSATTNFNLTSERPPDPNQVDGVQAPLLTGGSATEALVMQSYLKASLDTLALADAQTYVPFWEQWGNAAGKIVAINIPDARLGYPNLDLSGQVANESIDLLIDVFDRNLNIVFPF